MDFKEVMENARKCLGKCKGCPVCNGVACRNTIPGPGAKGVGDTAIRNYAKWQEVRVVMDTLCEKRPVDTSIELFDRSSAAPSNIRSLPARWGLWPCITATNTMM